MKLKRARRAEDSVMEVKAATASRRMPAGKATRMLTALLQSGSGTVLAARTLGTSLLIAQSLATLRLPNSERTGAIFN